MKNYFNRNEYTLEFNDIMDYMTTVLYDEFPTDTLSLPYLILSILDNRNCHANLILDNCLMSENIEELRKIYISVLESHMKPQLKSKKLVFDKDIVRAINSSKDEAEKLNSMPTGTEHLLLAILNKENEFAESEIFDKFRLEYDFIYNKCNVGNEPVKKQNERLIPKKITTKSKSSNEIPLKSQVNTKTVAKSTPSEFIDKYTTNLSKLAREGKIDEIIGRKNEINEIIKVLSRRKKNNAVLVGNGGCGKTAIVYGIANMIEKNAVPEVLENKEIIMMNPMAIVSGTHFRGMFEERVTGLFNELKKSDRYILFIDDIHTVLKNGNKDRDTDISGMVGEILVDGSVKVIATTTFKDYRNSIESNSSLSRKLQKIVIEPTTDKETIEILNNNKKYYEEYHNVSYVKQAIEKAVEYAERYINDRSLPDSAFDIIDLAGASTTLTSKEPDEIQNIRKRIREIEIEKANSLNNGDFEKIDALNAENNVLASDLAEYKRQTKKHPKPVKITENDIANVISEMTKIPISKLSANEKNKIANIDEVLKKSVIGQDEAVDSVCRVVKRNKVGLGDKSRTLGTLLLLGPSGVGKCVSKNTKITIRNKKTGEIQTVTVESFLVSRLTQEKVNI